MVFQDTLDRKLSLFTVAPSCYVIYLKFVNQRGNSKYISFQSSFLCFRSESTAENDQQCLKISTEIRYSW